MGNSSGLRFFYVPSMEICGWGAVLYVSGSLDLDFGFDIDFDMNSEEIVCHGEDI